MWHLNSSKARDFSSSVTAAVTLHRSFSHFEHTSDLGDAIFMWGVHVSHIPLNVDSSTALPWLSSHAVLYIECMSVLVVDAGSKIGVSGKSLAWGTAGSGRPFSSPYLKTKFTTFLISSNFRAWFGFLPLFPCDLGMGPFCLRWCAIFFNLQCHGLTNMHVCIFHDHHNCTCIGAFSYRSSHNLCFCFLTSP